MDSTDEERYMTDFKCLDKYYICSSPTQTSDAPLLRLATVLRAERGLVHCGETAVQHPTSPVVSSVLLHIYLNEINSSGSFLL